ncbi:MAG: Stf0 family sulfotransferase [Rhodospirillaceae bacterium]
MTTSNRLLDVFRTRPERRPLPRPWETLPRARRAYVIGFVPRSGSTWLSSVVDGTGRIGLPTEWFLPVIARKHADEGQVSTLVDYVDYLMRAKAGTDGFFGLKASFGQLLEAEAEGPLYRLFNCPIDWFRLYRRDYVLQGISLYRAVESGVFHSYMPADEAARNRLRELDYDDSKIHHWVRHSIYQEWMLSAYFERRGLLPIDLVYEDMVENPRATVAFIFKTLGLEIDCSRLVVDTNVRKLGSEIDLAWAERYRVGHADFIEQCDNWRGKSGSSRPLPPKQIAWIPVAWPKLPPAAAITPYLERIDTARQYSNFGPLNRLLEERLAARIHVVAERVVTVANGTLGLTAALMTAGVSAGASVLMPAWTFVATGHAVRMAGLVPYLVDVDPESGLLTPEGAQAALAAAPRPVGAVVPVLPFGQPVDLTTWDGFAAAHRIPVVIDAAAAFDAVRPAKAPMMVSLHATKVLGVGEGGFVVCPDTGFAEDLRRHLNFGFYHVRSATVPALNGKFSEYHAAVGLAALDRWAETRRAFQRVAHSWRRSLATALPDAALPDGYGETWVSSTTVIRLADPEADALKLYLANLGIDSRCWWGRGVHRHPAFAACSRTPLPATEALAERTLGLPCFVDLPDSAISDICQMLSERTHGAVRI